ncbi:hypothetical protein HZS_2196 [Henneguya salminicola]|nr:hypothetical protein HZS_2196 [Henneguya salminicola]
MFTLHLSEELIKSISKNESISGNHSKPQSSIHKGKRIKDILDQYLEHKFSQLPDDLKPNFQELYKKWKNRKENPTSEIQNLDCVSFSCACEITRSITAYFNKLLPKQLLYEYESKELEIYNPSCPYHKIYGYEYLIRLFIVLPDYIFLCGRMDQETIDEITPYFNDFIDWFTNNYRKFK